MQVPLPTPDKKETETKPVKISKSAFDAAVNELADKIQELHKEQYRKDGLRQAPFTSGAQTQEQIRSLILGFFKKAGLEAPTTTSIPELIKLTAEELSKHRYQISISVRAQSGSNFMIDAFIIPVLKANVFDFSKINLPPGLVFPEANQMIYSSNDFKAGPVTLQESQGKNTFLGITFPSHVTNKAVSVVFPPIIKLAAKKYGVSESILRPFVEANEAGNAAFENQFGITSGKRTGNLRFQLDGMPSNAAMISEAYSDYVSLKQVVAKKGEAQGFTALQFLANQKPGQSGYDLSIALRDRGIKTVGNAPAESKEYKTFLTTAESNPTLQKQILVAVLKSYESYLILAFEALNTVK